jgi:hypothetical protein
MIGSISMEHASNSWYLQASRRCCHRPYLFWSHLAVRPGQVRPLAQREYIPDGYALVKTSTWLRLPWHVSQEHWTVSKGRAMPYSQTPLTLHPNDQSGFLTELPFGSPGPVFRCPMPFSPYDPYGDTLQAFRELEISVIVLLAGVDECPTLTGRDLPWIYRQEGFQVVHLPTFDGGVPVRDQLDRQSHPSSGMPRRASVWRSIATPGSGGQDFSPLRW